MSLTQRVLTPIVQVRKEEIATMLSMFAYSFLAMFAYNIVQPITRSQFIENLGAANIPYVQFVAGLLIGVIMQGYTKATGVIPQRWMIPVAQAGLAGLLIVFWLLFQTGQEWVAVAFYFLGLILGILLISQFWLLANSIYDPRQAKRMFGFIGGGASLGGTAGAGTTALIAQPIGTNNLLLCSAAVLGGCAILVMTIIGKEQPEIRSAADTGKKEEGVGGREAFQMLRRSRQLQLIAVLISFAALGAAILDQQLNMATEEFRGDQGADAMTAFLAGVRFWISLIGFLIQIWLTSRIHRYLGIGFALLILPVSLTLSGGVILAFGVLAAPAFARVLDSTLRYTIDKTTREILFLPLPTEVKYRAKQFVDVTVDRFAKGLGALVLLVLIQPWGLNLHWTRLTLVTFTLVAIWFFMAVRAKSEYLGAFRRSIEARQVQADQLTLNVADLSTVETLVEELAHPDEQRVLYAIDVLESLDKRNLITPLLLHHESAAVRVRALAALSAARPDIAQQWLPVIQRMITDRSPEVRAAAVGALANIRNEDAGELARPLLDDPDPRIVATAAIVLAGSPREEDSSAAQAALSRLASDPRETSSQVRRDVAAAIRQIGDPRCRHLLIPLLYDPEPEVAEEAMRSVRELGACDFLYVPTLVSLLRHRRLKSGARDVLVGYGEQVLDALNLFLRDPEEDLWVRRHIPATIARIPTQKSMDILVAALEEKDSFLRYKVVAALEKLRREQAAFTFDRAPIEALALKEGLRYFSYLSLHHNLFVRAGLPRDGLLARALSEKLDRTLDRIYRLLGLLYPWKDIVAARGAIERGDARARASAFEMLDNILTGTPRKRLMPVLEELPLDEKVRRGNVFLRTRPRDVEETLLELINDPDQVVAATAIDLVRDRKLWTLADDVEYVLAHRDAQDQYAFEAASWTLAARGQPDEQRRARWLEPLPTVALADKLRGLPMFASVWADELFRIAGAGQQVRHEAGRVLFQEGAVPDSLQVLLDGKVASTGRRIGAREIDPPALLGFEEMLEGGPMRETIRTAEISVSLTLSNEDVRTLLADNTDLVQGLFRTLAERSAADGERPVIKGEAGEEIARLAVGGLSPIQKVLVLQRVPVFSRVSAGEMLHLAAIAREIPLEAGAVLSNEADPPVLSVVLSGELSLDSPSGAGRERKWSAGSGDSIGVYETLAGIPNGRSAHILHSGAALRIEREDLFDLLGQRSDLLQQLFSGLFRATA